ncbi:MAG: hypothetical protein MH204_06285, partial [Fimbriimonadaceae bacterium]|nr:hypothetical protein [Fimbriimonadaceae bacterium]
RPIALGGATVCPGDVVVADGDGVIVVPKSVAEQVGRLARKEQDRDRAGRLAHYQALGREPDETVG